jgi:hypothetical protein
MSQVKVAEQIHVNKPKNQGFAKKCHRQSQMLIQIPLSNTRDMVGFLPLT